jgi:ribosomal protein L37AE/L43A
MTKKPFIFMRRKDPDHELPVVCPACGRPNHKHVIFGIYCDLNCLTKAAKGETPAQPGRKR